jgi:hypothetical protein
VLRHRRDDLEALTAAPENDSLAGTHRGTGFGLARAGAHVRLSGSKRYGATDDGRGRLDASAARKPERFDVVLPNGTRDERTVQDGLTPGAQRPQTPSEVERLARRAPRTVVRRFGAERRDRGGHPRRLRVRRWSTAVRTDFGPGGPAKEAAEILETGTAGDATSNPALRHRDVTRGAGSVARR